MTKALKGREQMFNPTINVPRIPSPSVSELHPIKPATAQSLLRGFGLAGLAMLLLGGVPSSESPDFLLNTTLPRGELAFDESGAFTVDTLLTFDTPGYAESPSFVVDTRLSFRRPRFAESRDVLARGSSGISGADFVRDFLP